MPSPTPPRAAARPFRRAVLVLAPLVLPVARARADFDYIDFASTAGLTLVGAAAQNATELRLTPASAGQVGGVWHQTKQSVGAGFETTFTLQLGPGAGADGLVFVVQNGASAPLAGSGCQLGYHGLPNSIAVEFDSYSNATCAAAPVNDPAGVHVSVHTLGVAANSVDEAASLGATLAVPDFANGAVHWCRVHYDAGTLSVFVDNLATPVLAVAVDLQQTLALDQGRAWVGFTASTGALAEVHDLFAWSFDETPAALGNVPPAAPVITEPATNGQVVNPADVHMETAPFSDPNTGDQHRCTDWEIWTVSPAQRVWMTPCARGVEKLHTHLGDGTFVNSHAGRSDLLTSTQYTLRVRHSDDSGDPPSEWSPWSTRMFWTGSPATAFPLSLEDVATAPAPAWTDPSGAPVVLAPAATPSALRIESAAGALLLELRALDGASNTVINPPPLGFHAPVRAQARAGSQGLLLPATDLALVDEHCAATTILLPALSLPPGGSAYFWIASSGAAYAATSTQTTPTFATLVRGLDPPWQTRQSGFRVEVVAGGFQLPVNIAFVPNPGPNPGDPAFYVTELYGRIQVVARDRTVSTYASGLLDFNPTGAFPGSGEQGLTGIAVDPATGDVYASLLHAAIGNPSVHYPRIDRFTSLDGGKTAAQRATVLDMVGEPQGQSHQISNLTIAPDGRLWCHMGDGFTTATAQDLGSFRGKILRMELSGAAASDNPFYDAGNGITARDYVYAYGVRNPFGGDRRAADGRQYVVENGPSVDRFLRVVAGRNYLWDGSDASMLSFALYNWSPAHGPVNLAFVQPSAFGGSGFPAASQDHAFVTESGPTYAGGLQALGKRITEWVLDANGALVAGPLPFLEYTGNGKATACALEAGPDGLYFSELYFDQGTSATQAGARILRVFHVPPEDCNGNGIDDVCDLASGASPDVNANAVPDECDCRGAEYCTPKPNSLGCVPAIGATGSLTAGAPDDFVVRASNVLNNKPGIALWSTLPAATPFGGGTLCVQGAVHRLGGGVSGGSPSGSDCSGSYAVPFPDALLAAHNVAAGATLHFQVWSRDPGFLAPDNVGLTAGLRVLVCP